MMELMENEEIVHQANLNPFSARTRREPQGELMEGGHRHNNPRGLNFPTIARQPKNNIPTSRPSLNLSQLSLPCTARKAQRELVYQSHRDLQELPMAQVLNQQAIYSSQTRREPQGELMEDARRSIIVNTGNGRSRIESSR